MLSGLFVTNINLPDTIYNGKVTVTTAGTRVQLTSDVTNMKSGVVIKALDTNTGLIYVGDSSVGAANGYQLAAGDSAFFEIVNRSLIYIDSAEDLEGITYIATGVYSIVPSIASVAPVGGLPAGGTAITVTGGNFIGVDLATGVTIDGNPCTSVVVTSVTTLTAVSPVGTVGAKTLSVTGVGGVGTLASGFTYEDAPTASGISPSSGSEDGGTAVTITGTNFVNTPFVTGVTIGGAACTSVVAASDTSITAVTPAGTLGAQDVVVTTASGVATLTSGYTYTPAFVNTYSGLWNDAACKGLSSTACVMTGGYTLSFWCKIKKPISGGAGENYNGTIMGQTYAAGFPNNYGDFYIQIWGTSGKLRFAFRLAGWVYYSLDTDAFLTAPIATWHHVAVTVSSTSGATGDIVMYVDGATSGTGATGVGTSMGYADTFWIVGNAIGGNPGFTNAFFDEVFTLTTAASAADIEDIYNSGTPKDESGRSGIERYYRFEDSGDLGATSVGSSDITLTSVTQSGLVP